MTSLNKTEAENQVLYDIYENFQVIPHSNKTLDVWRKFLEKKEGRILSNSEV